MAGEGEKNYARDCFSCHERRAEFTNNVIPIAEIGTDPERMYSKDAAAEANRRVKQMGIDRPPMVDTQDPYGYVSPPLDGIWLRALICTMARFRHCVICSIHPTSVRRLFIAATMFSIPSM